MSSADDVRVQVADAWMTLRTAIAEADLDARTNAGWTVGEMVAHIGFWLETVPPFVTGAFRGDESAFTVTFPSGFTPHGEWPAADVHNAREAAWARQQSPESVVARCDEAYAGLVSFLTTVTDEEATTHADYFAQVRDHLDEHRLAELS